MSYRPDAGTWERSGARRPRLAPVVLTVVAVLAVAVATITLRSGGTEPVEVTEATAAADSGDLSFGRQKPLARPPGGGRVDAASAWTGAEWLLWGGYDADASFDQRPVPRTDGLAYDPAAEHWRRLPEAPLAPRAGVASVWTGDRLVVWGGLDPDGEPLADGAAYLAAEDRWEPLPPAPLSARFGAVALWSGGEVLIAGGRAGNPRRSAPPVARDVAALDPAAGTWRELAPVPDDAAAAPGVEFVAAGDRVLAWQRERGWVYDAERDGWAATPPPPEEVRVRASSRPVPLHGRRVLLVGASTLADRRVLGVVLDLDEGWKEAVGHGMPVAEPWYVRVLAGEDGTMVVLPDGPESFSRASVPAVMTDESFDRWVPVPRDVVRDRARYLAAWTGEELLVWGGRAAVDTGGQEGRVHADGTRWRLSDP